VVVQIKNIILAICLMNVVSCKKVDIDVFAVNKTSLLSPLQQHGADELIQSGPNGSRTISTRIHRITNTGDGWIIGVRKYMRSHFIQTEQGFVEKITLYFPNRVKPNGVYNIEGNNSNISVAYSRISPSFVKGCAAEAAFGNVNIEWISDKIFVVNIKAAFDMKYGLFCDPIVINETYSGSIMAFDELTPWLGRIQNLGTFDELHDELSR